MKRAIALLLPLLLLSPAELRAACVTDDTGTRVCLAHAPSRVVTLYGAFTETLAALGVTNSLVARTRDDTLPEVMKLPSVGTGLRPNVEYVLALRPDLVISRAGRAAAHALASLRARGLTVAAFDPSSLDDLYSTIERFGVLWNRTDRAHALSDRLRSDIAGVERRAAGVEPKLTVVYEVRAEPLTVAGTGGLVEELIRAAGGVNAVDSKKKLLSFDPEALLRLDPDVYIVQHGPMNLNPVPPAQRPNFQALKAVRDGRVLSVDEKLFARPGPHVAEAARRLSQFLYPELWREAPNGPAR